MKLKQDARSGATWSIISTVYALELAEYALSHGGRFKAGHDDTQEQIVVGGNHNMVLHRHESTWYVAERTWDATFGE